MERSEGRRGGIQRGEAERDVASVAAVIKLQAEG